MGAAQRVGGQALHLGGTAPASAKQHENVTGNKGEKASL